MNEQDRREALFELVDWITELMVAEAFAEGRFETQNRPHDTHSHLRAVQHRPPTRDIP